MSASKQVLIAQEVKLKIGKLIEQKNAMQQRIVELENQNEMLKSELSHQKNTIQTLQTQNKMVKIAEILPKDAREKQEIKKVISAYIRQIDDCIRLLSELA